MNVKMPQPRCIACSTNTRRCLPARTTTTSKSGWPTFATSIIRLSGHLSDVLDPQLEALQGPLVLVANELLPSQVVTLGNREVAGIVTETGGQTSHAAILARSRGIPAISGVRGILRQVKNGDTLVVDGREGHVLVNADAETTSAYLKLQREFFDLKDALAENRDQPAVSADGQKVQLLANINSLSDAQAAKAMGASGVGLFRTEYLFLTHPDVPDEEQQLAAYREIIEASPNQQITIRTLDLGGDKTIPYLGHAREANPFLGWRSIRLSFEHPEFFGMQIRAILRAAAPGTGHDEACADDVPDDHDARRDSPRAHDGAQGAAAAGRRREGVWPGAVRLHARSAGRGDLDRRAAGGSRLRVDWLERPGAVFDGCRSRQSESQPSVPAAQPAGAARAGRHRFAACNAADKPVTLCGEMAGAPRAFVLLFGMGLRSFSMSPAFIPMIKELTSHLTRKRAERILERAPRHQDHPRRPAIHGGADRRDRAEFKAARLGVESDSPRSEEDSLILLRARFAARATRNRDSP